jgi:hypothetical protein
MSLHPIFQGIVEAHGAPRAVPFNAVRFYPYRVTENGRTLPLIVDCATLEEAVEGGKVHCFHKDHLLVREVRDGSDRLHLYAIKKKSAPTYVYRDYGYHRQDRLYAAPVCVIDAALLGAGL